MQYSDPPIMVSFSNIYIRKDIWFDLIRIRFLHFSFQNIQMSAKL